VEEAVRQYDRGKNSSLNKKGKQEVVGKLIRRGKRFCRLHEGRRSFPRKRKNLPSCWPRKRDAKKKVIPPKEKKY